MNPLLAHATAFRALANAVRHGAALRDDVDEDSGFAIVEAIFDKAADDLEAQIPKLGEDKSGVVFSKRRKE